MASNIITAEKLEYIHMAMHITPLCSCMMEHCHRSEVIFEYLSKNLR